MKKHWSEIIVMYSIYLLMIACLHIIMRYMYFLKIEANIRLILQIMMTTLSLVPFLLNMKKNKEKFNKYIGKHASISTVSSVIICSVGVLMSIYLIMMTPSSTIMLLRIIFFLSVAVTEEYIFRGYFYRKFQNLFSSRKSGFVLVILLKSLSDQVLFMPIWSGVIKMRREF